jgi:hypothetical protein
MYNSETEEGEEREKQNKSNTEWAMKDVQKSTVYTKTKKTEFGNEREEEPKCLKINETAYLDLRSCSC